MNDAKKYIVSVLILLVAGMFGGCIKEDYSDCPRPFRLTVRAWDADMQDITETGAVQRVVIFVFDETGRRIDRLMMDAAQVAARKPIPLEYDGPTTVSFVAWACWRTNSSNTSTCLMPYSVGGFWLRWRRLSA